MANEGSTPTNKTSIGAIVLWFGNTEKPIVTHYFAGDLWYKVEQKLHTWINQEIPCMKLR